jgi:hypothetical protein
MFKKQYEKEENSCTSTNICMLVLLKFKTLSRTQCLRQLKNGLVISFTFFRAF